MAKRKKDGVCRAGGGCRQRAAADRLRQRGWQVVGGERLAAADVILLPMPLAAKAKA